MEKDSIIIELNKKMDEDRIINEKNLEIIQIRLHEQKEAYENKFLLQEEENHRKIVKNLIFLNIKNDIHLKHDDQLKELQSHFQTLLDQRVLQIQDDANEQIA